MKFEWREDRYRLVAEDDQDRAVLAAFQQRADEVQINHGTSLFRDHELIIYLPIKQHPQHQIQDEGSDE